MEVLVSLAILALVTALALGAIGPWLKQARQLEREGRFWRDVETAQLVVAELTTGARDPDQQTHRSATSVGFVTLAPRLSPTPMPVELEITRGPRRGDVLKITTPALIRTSTVLLDDDTPLRLASGSSTAETVGAQPPVIVEAKVGQIWSPVIVAPFPVNAPSHCLFDVIAQVCR